MKVTSVSSVFNDRASNLRAKVTGVFALLVAGNVAAWAWALITVRDAPILLGTAVLAYSFGLRHAFDADHIAAIDNVTRKLMQEGKRPVAVGFFFSLGHSTIVVALSIAIAICGDGSPIQIRQRHQHRGRGRNINIGVVFVRDRHRKYHRSDLDLSSVPNGEERRICGRRPRSGAVKPWIHEQTFPSILSPDRM
jgi:hypothetical protein